MPSQDVSVRIDRVNEALNHKGFEDLYAIHYEDTPGRMIVLHDDHGRLAHCDDEALIGIIEGSDDVAGLWSALDDSGMIRTASASRS